MVRSQKELGVFLSRLETFENPSLELEQYATPPPIAAEWIWHMALVGEVANKIIADAACGPGILGLGLLMLGAKKVFFIDKDEKAMAICIRNYNKLKEEYEIGEAEFITADISLFDHQVDIVVQNPPFGTQNKHIDKIFLEKAFATAPIIYSMHKYSTKEFVQAITKDHNYQITHLWRFEFKIKKTHKHHKKEKYNVDVGLWRLSK